MLKELNRDKVYGDIRSVGHIMIACLEPGTYLEKRDKFSETWDSNLMEFHKLTKSKSARELLQIKQSFRGKKLQD
jgi:hypothetical protein